MNTNGFARAFESFPSKKSGKVHFFGDVSFPGKKLKSTTGPASIFPDKHSLISSANKNIKLQTDRQADSHLFTLYHKSNIFFTWNRKSKALACSYLLLDQKYRNPLFNTASSDAWTNILLQTYNKTSSIYRLNTR